jgi:hypothetical protein
MFTADRGQVIDLDTVVLVDGAHRSRLSPEVIGGTDEIVLASVIVSKAIRAGAAALELLCHEVAGRVDQQGTVEVVTERHDAAELLRDDAAPLHIRVHARCEAEP